MQRKWRDILDLPAPTSGSPTSIAMTYLRRADAAHGLGDGDREVQELEAVLKIFGNQVESLPLWTRLGTFHGDRGNYAKALAVWNSYLKVIQNLGMTDTEHRVLANVVNLKASMFDLPAAEASLKDVLKLQAALRASERWKQTGSLWQSEAAWATQAIHIAGGNVAQAEASAHLCLGSLTDYHGGRLRADGQFVIYAVDCSATLISALRQQGKLSEAGVVADRFRDFIDAYAKITDRPLIPARIAHPYAGLVMDQGRIDEARAIVGDTSSLLRRANAGERSVMLGHFRASQATIEMIEGNWAKAEAIHRNRAISLRGGRTRESALSGGGSAPLPLTSNWAYSLVRLGHAQEAVDGMQRLVQAQEKVLDDSSLDLWDSRAFYGVALAAVGQRELALKHLSAAVPKLIELSNGERSSVESGLVRAKRFGWILDGYLGLLSDISKAGESAPIDVLDEAFRMADLARGSSVQRALAASASRANVSDPTLADLIRKEQDLQREVSSLADAIGTLLARGSLGDQDENIDTMRASLKKTRLRHSQIRGGLQRRYPEYASLINPDPLGIAGVQKALKPQEALLSIYVGSDRTLVWAIPAQGRPAFAVSPLGEDKIAEAVKKLRVSLDPVASIPAFDFETAHALYRALLQPVAAGWSQAKELIVVPHGALGSLPMAVLTTAPFQPKTETTQFSDYTAAPWLLKQVAISQLPAALAISTLRGRGRANQAPREFIGFGDPAFSATQVAMQARSVRSVARRNLVINVNDQPKPSIAARPDFNLLQALPDTAEEVAEIAKVLKADSARDVFLQRRATESNVKTQDLSAYRVVMFATHGLVPGEMPGIYEPALVLSNPALTGEKNDGFLTMEEILALKLNADWVVLSACNTASPSGQGSEAVSGLGRAFFYAGAKALLVSSWPVETVSARLLTTDIFRRHAENVNASRAGALRESSLQLMQQKTADYSYAHPMFWAPFIVVGDGG